LSTNKSVALTGVGASGAVGTIVYYGANVSGVAASGAVGSVSVAERSLALTGVPAAGAVGSAGVNLVIGLTGVSSAGNVGSVGVGGRSFALTGVYAQADVGVVTAVYWKLIDDIQSPNWQNVNTA
jgi:hypothetical protein